MTGEVPTVIGNCTSVQLTQLDHERGVSGGAGCQRISAETWVWQNNQYLKKWQAGSACDG